MPESNQIESLLTEYKQNRDDLKLMLKDIQSLKEKIDTLFPDKLDNRYMHFFEEKVKTATEMFKALLDIRKEISKSLKDEIELRRKMVKEEEHGDDVDIMELADKVEELKTRCINGE